MSISNCKLPLEGNAILLDKLAEDYTLLINNKATRVPSNRHYLINCTEEPSGVKRSARKKAIKTISSPIVKQAFDTRHIDQQTERNPRTNLQYWNRSAQFINEQMQNKINTFTKLIGILKEIKAAYGTEPEYFNSYARILYDQVDRALLVKNGQAEVFEPQIAYLEQLLHARYHLSLDDIIRMGNVELKKVILDKDETLLKRGVYLEQTGGMVKNNNPIVIDGNSTQKNIIEAIFGNNNIRRDGEKRAQRTVTIIIKDEEV